MRVIVLSFLMICGSAWTVTAQSSDEPPKIRRRARAEGEFKVSYAEGSLFQHETKTVSGTLKFFHCAAVPRLVVLSEGKDLTLEITEPGSVEVKGGKSKTLDFACGKQKGGKVSVEYYESKGAKILHAITLGGE